LSHTVPHEFISEPVPEVVGTAIIFGTIKSLNSLFVKTMSLYIFFFLFIALKANTAFVKSITLPPPIVII
jgi:hypothetical protein